MRTGGSSRRATGGPSAKRRPRGTYLLEPLPDGGTRISFELEFLELPAERAADGTAQSRLRETGQRQGDEAPRRTARGDWAKFAGLDAGRANILMPGRCGAASACWPAAARTRAARAPPQPVHGGLDPDADLADPARPRPRARPPGAARRRAQTTTAPARLGRLRDPRRLHGLQVHGPRLLGRCRGGARPGTRTARPATRSTTPNSPTGSSAPARSRASPARPSGTSTPTPASSPARRAARASASPGCRRSWLVPGRGVDALALGARATPPFFSSVLQASSRSSTSFSASE